MGKFDFHAATAAEIDEYVMGKLIWQNQELSHVLIGHLMIEGLLGALIARSLPQPEKLMEQRNLTFDLKLNLANALGLLTFEHFAAARALNKIRNQCSHNPDYEITLDDLSPFKFGWVDIQKQAFEAAKIKGISDATLISISFLSFSFQALLGQPR